MPETTENEKGETLNDVSNLESTTSGLDYKYKTSNDAGRLYKNIIKSLSNYSKGELFTTEDIRDMIRNEYEVL
jgi:hypothetical protein